MGILDHRRALHRIPELDKDLPKTMAYLRSVLETLPCRVFSPGDGALCAWFDFGRSKAIAFRSDMDALPIREKTGLPFASCHPGRMHACGHDGHMAILLELARRLGEKQRLPRNVLLIFQGAEETTGGARDICGTGIFEEYAVEAIFALHLWPGLAAGHIASRRGEMMSRSCELHVEILGRSAHIAKAWEGLDALAAGVEFYRRAMALEQALPRSVFRLLKFGKMESGTVCNAVSGRTMLSGSLRAFQDEVFFGLKDDLAEIARDIEAETGCSVTLHTSDGYPAVMNPSPLYDKIRSIADFEELSAPSMITEDFSWYQRRLPGLFFFLGTGDTPALHRDNFNFDEGILSRGADFFEEISEGFS